MSYLDADSRGAASSCSSDTGHLGTVSAPERFAAIVSTILLTL